MGRGRGVGKGEGMKRKRITVETQLTILYGAVFQKQLRLPGSGGPNSTKVIVVDGCKQDGGDLVVMRYELWVDMAMMTQTGG